MRQSEIRRKTAETDIELRLCLDGNGTSDIKTGCGFLNHMLTLFAKHGRFDLFLRCAGDVDVDFHHTTEDVGICLGDAFRTALGDMRGVTRYGHCILPMDETLALVALDLSGRPCLVWNVDFPAPMIRDLDTRLFCEFFQALVNRAGMNLHVRKMAGEEVHHVAEAVFKAFAKALDQAVTHDPRVKGVLSTKGSL